MSNAEKKFLADIKKHLDTSVDNLDGVTRSRLNRIRTQALKLHTPKPSPLRHWFWVGSAALPALALGFLIYFRFPEQQSHDLHPSQIATNITGKTTAPFEVASIATLPKNIDAEDLDILLDEEDLEMLSDLEFLSWLSNEEEVGG